MRTVNHNVCVLVCWVMLALTACHTPGKQEVITKIEDNVFLESLAENRIDSSNYYISLPENFRLTKSEGPDFVVYYFSPSDTLKETYSGGFYFGNFPHKFNPASDSCKITSLSGDILSGGADWTIFNCDGAYSIQTIVDSRSGEDWNRLLHAFGGGRSKEDIRKLTTIYATLRKDKQR